PESTSYEGGFAIRTFDSGLRNKLTELARTNSVSLYMVLRAALAALLSRLSGQHDIPIGTSVAGRTEEGLEDLVGFFVNTLVLRTDLSGRPTFRELLAQVRKTDLEAYGHQDLPFDRLVEVLNPVRTAARHPLFQVMLGFQNAEAHDFRLHGLEVEELTAGLGAARAKYDLEFICREQSGGGIECAVLYSSDLFDEHTVSTLVGRLERLLTAIADDPDIPVCTVDILSAEEKRTLLTGPSDPVPDTSLPELFEAQAARTPGRAALIWAGQEMSYAELDTRSNRLAHRLRQTGVGAGDMVAVILPHCADLVVALLGIMKAGAAYVPIAPELPAQRINFMRRDSRPKHVFDDTEVVARWSSPEGSIDHRPAHRPRPADAAYVIYTSGSTGRPKGVTIEHRALTDYLTWTGSAYDSADGTTLLHSPISFDLTVTALYTPLVKGGCVILAGLEERAEKDLPPSRPCTFLKATPSHLPLLNALPGRFSPSGELLLGGEALIGSALSEWRRRHPGATVLNVYGPTESTVNCAEYRIPPGAPVPAGPVPIGRPQSNARLYVLDAELLPLPPGVTGELYLAGAGLARGYLNQQALTAERFVADPFGPPGARMYRSGDLARYRPDGNLEFVGRADNQVKVRGFRIEPAEIEAVLARYPGVARAKVVATGNQQLAAYVTPAALNEESLRGHIANELPGYMVPDLLVLLDDLPLTHHGKLDVARLPDPTHAPTRPQPATTPTEAAMARIWSDLLHTEHIGQDEDFFTIGGHSLLAARLLLLIREEFGVNLPLQRVFTEPTVRSLSAAVEALLGDTPTGGDPDFAVQRFAPAALAAELIPEPLSPSAFVPPARILLTGATGFVGGHLVHHLLSRAGLSVHCLVRARDQATGLARVREVLRAQQLWDDAFADRLHIIPGDLAQPGLGLSEADYDTLADTVDAVFHNGAHVDALLPYERLVDANVGGTGELLRLAATGRSKPFHLVSTVSAAPAALGMVASGYAQSKWHAEQLVTAAGERGLAVSVCRLPRMTGNVRTGHGNDRDIVFRLLRIIVALGKAPDLDVAEDWIPVDLAASALAALAVSAPDGQKILLSARNQMKFGHIVELLRERGRTVETVPVEEWLALLATRKPEEHALYRLIFRAPELPDGVAVAPHAGFDRMLTGDVDTATIQLYLDHLLK
ncbi:amino acid adenylation domain-containing protein, partial [Streptomyces sp. ACA25]|uniref:non-ribosomal peptide synthetase n=1 Tax=Streptomyces sp. ACA25 TaxID=3022596 RepID=UPI0023072A12